MPDIVLASASETLRRQIRGVLGDHGLSVTAVTSAVALTNLVAASRAGETRVAVIDLDLPRLTDQQIRLVLAGTPPTTGFIFLWDDAEDVQRIHNVTLRQCRFIAKSSRSDRGGVSDAFLRELIDGILTFASWKHGSRIQDVILDPGQEMLSIVFRNGRSYSLPRKLIPDLDKSGIKSIRVHRDGSAFAITQNSGKITEVPWDFVLYHLEPEYEHYKGRNERKRFERLTARRVGRRLKQLRTSLGLTASEVAARSGIRRPNLSRLESGRHIPNLQTLERLAAALGVPVADLVA